MTHSNLTWLVHTWHTWCVCAMTHVYVTWLIRMWHDVFISDMPDSYVTCLVHVWHAAFTCDVTTSKFCEMLLLDPSEVWHDSFKYIATRFLYVTWWHPRLLSLLCGNLQICSKLYVCVCVCVWHDGICVCELYAKWRHFRLRTLSFVYESTTEPHDALQHAATHCTTLQHTATHCNPLGGSTLCGSTNATLYGNTLWIHKLQHTATHCDTLQHSVDPQTSPTKERRLFYVCLLLSTANGYVYVKCKWLCMCEVEMAMYVSTVNGYVCVKCKWLFMCQM